MIKNLLSALLISFLLIAPNAYSEKRIKKTELNEISTCSPNTPIPFKAKGDFLSVWDGSGYTELFIKGINMGVAVPGTQPGELAASREQYQNWLQKIKEIGYNVIRTYTLHYPRFYEELEAYNLAHPQNPILLLQGVWLDEDSGFDLYNLTSDFEKEIEENINSVHGNASIDHRFGKAYGTYTTDVSKWVIGYLIGREVYGDEIAYTNANHAEINLYNGNFLSITDCSASEAWICARLDKAINYENENYDTQRPVAFSSWPTLDPLTHPTETDHFGGIEDNESVDLSKIDGSKAEAGFFISYHAYPYYPDFLSMDPGYQEYFDSYGPNSYLGYLYDLKNHYAGIPLIIAEFGVPTSWATAHFSTNGMYHGSMTEEQQGIYAIRMLENYRETNIGGGVQFSLIDEWFKIAWITYGLEDAEKRPVWQNTMNPENNFGIIEFVAPEVDRKTIGTYENSFISNIQASADYKHFNIDMALNTENYTDDEFWIAIDTYDPELGESILPNAETYDVNGTTSRAEFALKFSLADTAAYLYVTKAYDVYGVRNLYRLDTLVSTTTNGAGWDLVRWRTNEYDGGMDQNTGVLELKNTNQPRDFIEGVRWNADSIKITLPWTLINFFDPSQMKVTHFMSKLTDGDIDVLTRSQESDGIALTVIKGNEKVSTDRFIWKKWDVADVVNSNYQERDKKSLPYIKDRLGEFNSAPIALCDTFTFNPKDILNIDQYNGLIGNDIDYDGTSGLEVVPADEANNLQGLLNLLPDGSFSFTPDQTASGTDQFQYYLTDGEKESKIATVTFVYDKTVGFNDDILADTHLRVYPNPSQGKFNLELSNHILFSNVRIYTITGQLIKQYENLNNHSAVDLTNQQPGVYILEAQTDNIRECVQLIKF